MKKYDKVVQFDSDFKPIDDITVLNKLPSGIYEINQNRNDGEIFFSKIKTNHDDLVDLPDTEYDQVIKEIHTFMEPATRKAFEDNGFVYKRSTLLYGPPGTGKTCIVNRIAQSVVQEGGVALFSPNPKLLEESFKILDSIQPETRVMVIFEELDQLMDRYESELLNILDGEIQKSNVVYVATTNYIEKIPARIRRPGRFSSVVQVSFPTANTRRFYLNHKFKGKLDIESWVQKTEGFSVDELKETVLSVLCLRSDLDTIVARIKENKGDIAPIQEGPECYMDDEKEEFAEDPILMPNKRSR